MEMRHWLIGGGVVAAAAAVIFGMITINVGSAIAKCEKAGYATPEQGLSVSVCPADEDYAHDSVALVVGNVASSPKPALTDETSKYLRNSLALAKGDLDMFIYSATPGGNRINDDGKKVKKAGSVDAFIRNSSKKIDAINTSIQQQPTENGVDYFNNILAAARAVKTSPKVENPLIVVIGSGLSDVQPLNFAASDLLHADPADVLSGLRASGVATPGALSGIKIVWSGLGVTANPQQPLDAKEKANLQRIYATVLEYMGATLVNDDTVMTADAIDTDKTVSKIKVDGLAGGVVVYKLGENTIGFVPDTATIKDTTKANDAVTGIVENYQRCTAAKITIEGYQARPNGGAVEATSDLSQQRANAVKNLLVARGVNAASVTAVGRGSSDFAGRIDETNAEGKWDTTRAQANRIVLVKMDGGGSCNG